MDHVSVMLDMLEISKKFLNFLSRSTYFTENCNLNFISNFRCECNLQEYSSTKELDNLCREPYKVDNEIRLGSMCHDRGECLCGQCWCNVNYGGKYCECDSCPL